MESHQQALIDQAIRHALIRYDDQHSLLRSSEDPRFRVVPESLCFAALLLVRSATGKGRQSELGLARLLIDTLLPLQNTTRRDPSRGAFPMLWTPDSSRTLVMDPDSREIMGSLLGLLVKDYSQLLGEKRCARIRDAVRLSIRSKEDATDLVPAERSTSSTMISAWLELEFGDQWRGERLATEVALAGQEQLLARRFGDARAFARELWALSLWRRSSRLHDGVAGLVASILGDIGRYAHPGLPEMFGAVTSRATSPDAAYPWLGTWMTWHALGSAPLLPKHLSDPLHSTLFAFPALAKLKLAADEAVEDTAEHRLEHVGPAGTITGWWEPALHVEARESKSALADRIPVAGARWRTPEGETAWLRCRVARTEAAACRKRFVHLQDPGTTIINVHNLGPGETRMIENGWWLAGLHFATQDFQMVDAERTALGLELQLRPTGDQPMLMFSPLK